MCCGKETYEEMQGGRVGLTRRKVLKAMGAGAGLVALGGLTGCTAWLADSGFTSESSAGKVSAAGTASDRLKKALSRVDQKLIHEINETKEAWSRVWKMAFHNHESDRASVISTFEHAKKKTRILIDQYDRIDFIGALESLALTASLADVNTALSQDTEFKRELEKRFMDDLVGIGFSERDANDEVQRHFHRLFTQAEYDQARQGLSGQGLSNAFQESLNVLDPGDGGGGGSPTPSQCTAAVISCIAIFGVIVLGCIAIGLAECLALLGNIGPGGAGNLVLTAALICYIDLIECFA